VADDGTLMVVRPGVVDSANAASAKEVLKQSGQNVLGQVVNGVNSDNPIQLLPCEGILRRGRFYTR